jgi:hypothetical protein
MSSVNNYRLYTLVNMYFSSIQQGIQTAHVVGNFIGGNHVVKHPHNNQNDTMRYADNNAVLLWAMLDKTIIVLNGGMTADIVKAYDVLSKVDQEVYPSTCFIEAWDACNSLSTIGIILPENVYNSVLRDDGLYVSPSGQVWSESSDEHAILKVIKQLNLAR